MNRGKPPTSALSRRAALVGAAQAMALLAAGCTQLPVSPAAAPATAAPAPTASATEIAAALPDPACASALPQTVAPTPIPYPGYVGVEPSTGLHVTAPPQVIDHETYRLAVKGKVARELSLTYDELRCLPKIGGYMRIECPGFFVDHSNLAGAALTSVLALAGPLPDANRVQFTGVDGRTDGVSLSNALASEYFLAYEWEGEALPASHGFPVRMALPDNLGGAWVKWVMVIDIS